MSWLRPDNVRPSDYDPEKRVAGLVERLGQLSGQITDVFNKVDPLYCFYGDNVDEYVGYVERFFSQLGSRDFSQLTDEGITAMVRGSFHESQIVKGFLDEKDLELLVQKIIQLRNTPAT